MTGSFAEKILAWILSGGGIIAVIKFAKDYFANRNSLEGVSQAQSGLIEDYESAAEYWRERANELHDRNESIKEQNELLRQQNDFLKREVSRKEKENEKLLQKIDALEDKNELLAEQIEHTTGYIDELRNRFENMRQLVRVIIQWIPDKHREELEQDYGHLLEGPEQEEDGDESE